MPWAFSNFVNLQRVIMLYGINITSLQELPIAQSFFHEGLIDFVEILIDNYKDSDATTFHSAIGNIPHAVHIMSSRFIETNNTELDNYYKSIYFILSAMKPIYISDHLARFTLDGIEFPAPMELDYEQEKQHILKAIDVWQSKLGCKLYLETFASILDNGKKQANFFTDLLCTNKNVGVLFDVSNMVVGYLNHVINIQEWTNVMLQAQHFHVSGYSYSNTMPKLIIDSHNTPISEITLNILFENKIIINKPENTIVIERDSNYDELQWRTDIINVKKALDVSYAYQKIA